MEDPFPVRRETSEKEQPVIDALADPVGVRSSLLSELITMSGTEREADEEEDSGLTVMLMRVSVPWVAEKMEVVRGDAAFRIVKVRLINEAKCAESSKREPVVVREEGSIEMVAEESDEMV